MSCQRTDRSLNARVHHSMWTAVRFVIPDVVTGLNPHQHWANASCVPLLVPSTTLESPNASRHGGEVPVPARHGGRGSGRPEERGRY